MGIDSTRELLLDVWREVCRHIAIDESVARVTPLLVPQLPLEEILVRQIDAERGVLDTVAVGLVRAAPNHLGAKTQCGPHDLARIIAWCHQGKLLRGAEREVHKVAPWSLACESLGALLAGALESRPGAAGSSDPGCKAQSLLYRRA